MSDLRELIADRIRTSGPISFAEFMELSLYHPELGYYARAAQKTGRAGDFFTSVDVGPIFGELLAKQFGEMWRILSRVQSPESKVQSPESSAFDLLEAGASNGRLARDVLDAAQRTDPEFYSAIRLSLVEQSHTARAAHERTLGPHAGLLNHSSSGMPEDIHGVIFANELLDALPTHSVVMTESGLREIFVDVDLAGNFVERLLEPSTPRIADYLSRAGASMPKGARAEVNLAAEDWMKTAAKSLRKGFMLIIDYGHEEAELYGGSHATGTLTGFKRHSLIADSLQEPGESDITAHVDLTALTHTATRAGLDVIGRLDQTYFLLGLGVGDLGDMPLKQRLALKTLLLPGGLGSTHKVLIFGKNVGAPALKGLSYRVRLT
ncbi:MAG TPA: SAM-dependent methyltransferase [Vicinamibacterales bacterium]|nr:SAM-dependent methyltransferase [Vicinamibacterales bacterium]